MNRCLFPVLIEIYPEGPTLYTWLSRYLWHVLGFANSVFLLRTSEKHPL